MDNSESNKLLFDEKAAREITESFARLTGVRCCVAKQNYDPVCEYGKNFDCRLFCKKLFEETGRGLNCTALHQESIIQAERFGGRYIYSCDQGIVFTTSPINTENGYVGAVIAGPVAIMSDEDILSLSKEDKDKDKISPALASELKELMQVIPHKTPADMNYISNQVFANAVFIGDSSQELFETADSLNRQNEIHKYILSIKSSEGPNTYPIEAETELYNAVSRGDRNSAYNYLNYVLGYIFSCSSDAAEIKSRISEVFVMMSRGAIHGGANPQEILAICQNNTELINVMRGEEEITSWLASGLRAFTDRVFETLDVKHSQAIHRAIEYMSMHYANQITLGEVAAFVGYSQAYFSRVFKEEAGKSFKEYLNMIRIDRSKSILMTSGLSIADISSMVGFNDQSYFCKTFNKLTGVTPDKYRKRVRRIDTEKEYGG